MSTTIDQRVVEMRFDNKHFETNVATTMSTLDKLKQKLHLDGASKGLENINNAAKNVKMDSLGGAVETVTAKFSALQVMGVTALANITNSAVNAGKRIVSALTIDPVRSGFNEYELKMNSVQTIMSSTGASIETVNAYLEELNKYSDQTIYSFQDMTQNIGKFTNAGVNLEDAVAAIKGISNEAAVSGANANEASRAMYNFAQALSAGYVKLIDWKSIENANMATVEFKQQLIDAAVAAGTLTEAGDGLYKTLDGTVMNATKNFNDTLQDQWMTSEVLITTLKKYADATTDIGKKASAAATEVKTFSMLFDTLKEAAQSGWAQTWEIMFGDLEEAKAFFTGLSDLVGGLLGDMSDWRNNILGNVFDSNYDKLVDKLGEAGVKVDDFHEAIRKLLVSNGETNESIDETIEKYGGMEEAIRGGAFSTEILKDALKSIGIGGSKASEAVSKFVEGLEKIERILGYGSVGDDVKTLQETLEALGHSVGKCGLDGIIGPDTTAAIKEFQKEMGLTVDGIAGPETLAALKKASKGIDKIADSVDDAAVSYDDLLDNITKKGGRELFLEGFKNAIGAIVDVLKVLGKAWSSVFPAEEIQKKLMKLVEWFNKFTKTLRLFTEETVEVSENGETVEKTVSKLNETGEKLKSVFEGLFSAIKIVATVLSGPLRFAANIITKILGNFGVTILDVAASLGDWLTSISKTVDKVTDFIADNVAEWIKQFKETEFFKTVAGWFEDASKTISDAVDNISKRISEFNTSTIVERLKTFYGFLSNIADNIKNSEIFMTIVDGVCSAFDKLKEFFGRFKLPEFNIDNLKTFFTDITKIGEKIGGSGSSGFIGVITGFGKHIKDNILSWNWTVFKETALEKFTTFWLKTGDKIKKAFETGKEIANTIKEFLFGTEKINLPTIMDAVTKFLWIVTLMKAIKLMDTMVSPFDNISDALNNFATSLKWDAMATAFKAMALALVAFTACVVVIASMDDMGKAWSAAGMLIALMVVMGAVVSAMAFFASKVEGGVNAAGAAAALLMVVASIALLVYTLKEIDKLDLNHTGRTFMILAGILATLSVGVSMISKAGGSSFRSVAAILTLMAALKLILDVITAYDEFDWTGKSRAIDKMLQMLLALSVAIRIASGGTKAGASSTGLALTLIAMVASLKILIGVIEDFAAMDTETLKKGGTVVAGIVGLMTAMLAVVNLTSKGTKLEKGERSVNNFTGLAMALLAVVGAIWLLGKIPIDELKQGGLAVGQILILFTAMLATLGLTCSGLKIGSLITMLITIGLLMAELTVIIKYLEGVPWQSSLSSAGALSLILLAMASTLRVLTKYDIKAKNIYKWIGALTVLSVLMGALAFVLYSIKNMDPLNAMGNAVALSILLVAMAGVLNILSTLDMRKLSPKKMGKLAAMFVGMTAILAILGLVLTMMSALNVNNAIPNAVALGVLLNAMSSALLIMSNSKTMSWKKMGTVLISMTVLSAILYALVGVLQLMKTLDPISAIGHVTALSIMLNAMSSALLIMSNSKTMNWKKMGTVLISMTVLSAILYALAGVLQLLKTVDPLSAVGHVAALSIMLNAMSSALIIMSNSKTMNWKKMGTVLISMTVLSAILYALVGVLHLLKTVDPLSAIGHVTALSILLNAMSSALLIMSNSKTMNWKKMGTVLVSMTALSAILYALVGVLHLLKTVDPIGVIPNAIALGVLLDAMAVALLIISNVRSVSASALVGMAAMSAVVALLAVVLGALAVMKCALSISTAISLSVMLLAMSAVFVILGMTGSMASAAIQGAIGLVAVITIIGTVAIAIGSLMSLIPAETIEKWKTGLENFMDFLVILAEGLGKIVSGFVVGFTDGLAEAAENLKTFVNALGEIDPEAVTGVQALCDAINALTAANLKDSLTQLLPGDNSLSTFGENIKGFATCIKDAAASLSDITDEDVDNIKRSAAAGEALAELNACIPAQGGIWQSIAGEKDLATWGTKISAFADSLIAYSTKVSGQTINSEAITKSAEAATSLSDLNNSIPKQGGIWQTLAGAQDMATWGAKLIVFADALVGYSSKVSGKNIDKEAILNSADAASALSDVANAIPTSGGIWQLIAGEHDMSTFGSGLSALADGLVNYATAATQIDQDKIDAIKRTGEAVDEIKAVTDKLPKTGGVAGWFGEKDPNAFGTGINALATGINTYCTVASTIDQDDIDAIGFTKNAVSALTDVVNNIPDLDDDKTPALKTAVTNLKGVCSTINSISTAEYDFSGTETLKSAIKKVLSILTDISVFDAYTDFQSLSMAVTSAVDCAKSIATLNGYTYGGVDTLKGALTSLAGADVDGVISAFSGKAESMRDAVASLVDAMVSGLNGGTSKVTTAATNIATATVKAIKAKADEFKSIGNTFASNLANGIKAKATSASIAAKTVGTKAASGARTKYSGMYTAGQFLGTGLVNGIKNKWDDAYNAGYTLGQKAVQGEKDGQQSESPSKATIKAGKWLGEGLVIGINRMGSSVYEAGRSMGKDAVGSISNSIRKISDIVESDMDTQPTIRPVLDLSDVRAGVGSISKLLSGTSSIGVNGNISAISSMMNSRSQNGANTDVVSAIDKLSKKMDNLGNTTYQVNGVTYDDGSNITDAVRTIVRAARIERRV